MRPLLRVEPCFPKSFIDVDIPQAGDEALIEQKWFQLPLAGFHHRSQTLGGKDGIEWLGSQASQNGFSFRRQINPPELARVVEAQFAAVDKAQHHMLVALAGRSLRNPVKPAGHSQMNQQAGAVRKIKYEELSPAADADYPLLGDQTAEFRCGRFGDRPFPKDPSASQGFPNDADRVEISCDRFNFGQFRHNKSVNECGLDG